jgi:hypothetical protein
VRGDRRRCVNGTGLGRQRSSVRELAPPRGSFRHARVPGRGAGAASTMARRIRHGPGAKWTPCVTSVPGVLRSSAYRIGVFGRRPDSGVVLGENGDALASFQAQNVTQNAPHGAFLAGGTTAAPELGLPFVGSPWGTLRQPGVSHFEPGMKQIKYDSGGQDDHEVDHNALSPRQNRGPRPCAAGWGTLLRAGDSDPEMDLKICHLILPTQRLAR